MDDGRKWDDRWERIRTNSLPANVSVAESKVLKSNDRWIRESGVTFRSIKPLWKHADEEYMTLECRVDAVGDLPSLTRYLYELEKDPLALKVEDLELGAKDADGQQLSLGVRFTALQLTPSSQ